MRKKIKISFIGKSEKFVKIFKSLYPKAIFNLYSWRSLDKIITNKKIKHKNDMVVICGYDYASQWYSYKKYYERNVINPSIITKMLSKKNTKIIYIDTIDKITKKKKLKKRNTFSRYEFAKKELRKILLKNFKLVKILTLPILINGKNKADIHGGIITKIIYNSLIALNYVKIINNKNLKKIIIKKISSIKREKVIKLTPVLLNIPRSLFFDRLLRYLND